MDCSWIKVSPSVTKGINVVNQLDDSKFEQFLRRIVSKMKVKDSEIFSADEQEILLKIFELNQENLMLAIKILIFIFKRLLKFIFMPQDLKNDLKSIGLSFEKADFIVKLWSIETRETLNELGGSGDPQNNMLDLSWKLHAELSSDLCKKSKIPKTYISLVQANKDIEIELTHTELYSMFLQFEAIQNELDNLDS